MTLIIVARHGLARAASCANLLPPTISRRHISLTTVVQQMPLSLHLEERNPSYEVSASVPIPVILLLFKASELCSWLPLVHSCLPS